MNNFINKNENNKNKEEIHELYYDVIVVGCGPNGALLGNLFGQLGIKTLIVEASSTFTQVPRAAHLDDEGLRILKRVGLDEEVLKQSYQLDVKFNKSFCNGNLTSIKPDITELNYPRSIFWFQPHFEETIRNGFLTRYSSIVKLITNCQVVSIEKQKQSNEEEEACEEEEYENQGIGNNNKLNLNLVGIENLSNGIISKVKCKFIIGSDGGNSFVRKCISSKMNGSTGKMKWLVVDAKIGKDHPPLPNYFQFSCNPIRPSLSLPIPPDHFRWEFVVFENESSKDLEHPDILYPLLQSHNADLSKLEIIRKSCYTFQNRIADKWYDNDSILLVGDSCHLVPPFLGMGISSGFRDSLNIVWKIDLILKGLTFNPHSILSSYQIERQPSIEIITKKSNQAGELIMMTNKYKAIVRNIILSTFLSIPIIEKLFHNKAGMKPSTTILNGLLDKQSISDSSQQQQQQQIIGESIPQPYISIINNTNGNTNSVLLDQVLGIGFSFLFFNCNQQENNRVLMDKLILKLSSNPLFKMLNSNFIKVINFNQKNSNINNSNTTTTTSTIIDDSKDTLHNFIYFKNSKDSNLNPTLVIIRPDKYIFGVYDNSNFKYSIIVSSLAKILNLNFQLIPKNNNIAIYSENEISSINSNSINSYSTSCSSSSSGGIGGY